MKQYYAIIDKETEEISGLEVSSIPESNRVIRKDNKGAEYLDMVNMYDTERKDVKGFNRGRYLDLMVIEGEAVCITKREARVYTQLLNEKDKILRRLRKISEELGVN